MRDKTISPHRWGLQAYLQQAPRALGLLLIQFALRVVAVLPLVFSGDIGQWLGLNENGALGLGLAMTFVLYVLIVMPFRFQAGARKAQLLGLRNHSQSFRYGKWLTAALLRLVRALPFLLPFLAFAGLYNYYMTYPDFSVPMMGIPKIGALVGGGFLEGVLLIGVLGLLTAVLAYYGWARDLAFEHSDVAGIGVRPALKKARRLAKNRRRSIIQTIFINFLLCLPAVLGVGFAVILSLPRTGSFKMDYLSYATTILKLNFPLKTIYIVIAVLVVLWLPLQPWRKLALASVLSDEE